MEFGESIRCNGPRSLRKIGAWAAIALFLVAWACEASALEGRVIDGSTGLPLAGVYVIGAWEVTTPFPVQARSGCAKLDLQSTDKEGVFILPGHSGRLLPRLIGTEHLNVSYYKPKYRFDHGREWLSESVVMLPEPSGTRTHYDELNRIMVNSDCGTDPASVSNRLLIFRAIYDEVAPIASTLEERISVARMLYWIEVIEIGEQRATENFERRQQEERAKQ